MDELSSEPAGAEGSVKRPVTKPQPDQRVQLTDAILDAYFENCVTRSQELVTDGLRRIKALEQAPEKQVPKEVSRKRVWNRLMLVPLATAAILLLTLMLPNQTSKPAMAAVSLSIQRALEDIGRKYSLTCLLKSSSGNEMYRNANLYVKGGDRFAIETESLLGFGPLWLGSSEGKAWVVPPIGPVLEGDQENLLSWVDQSDEVSTPYLHISTILYRIQDSYALTVKPETILWANTKEYECQYIVGSRKDISDEQLPKRIELWVDARSGIAVRVKMNWGLAPGESGRESLTVEYVDEVALDDTFFLPESHGGSSRVRSRFN
ncbi:MAG: hypothetical protein AAF394_14265 [Planctomycetota bacterium]